MININNLIKDAHWVHDKIYSKSVSYYFKEEFNKSSHLLKKSTLNFIQDGQKVTFEEYKKLLKYQDDLFLRFNKEIKNIDIIITHQRLIKM